MIENLYVGERYSFSNFSSSCCHFFTPSACHWHKKEWLWKNSWLVVTFSETVVAFFWLPSRPIHGSLWCGNKASVHLAFMHPAIMCLHTYRQKPRTKNARIMSSVSWTKLIDFEGMEFCYEIFRTYVKVHNLQYLL